MHQRVILQTTESLESVECYIDDILVWGNTRQEYDERLKNTFQFDNAADKEKIQILENKSEVYSALQRNVLTNNTCNSCTLKRSWNDCLSWEMYPSHINSNNSFKTIVGKRCQVCLDKVTYEHLK